MEETKTSWPVWPIWVIIIGSMWLSGEEFHSLRSEAISTHNELNALQIKVASDPAANDRKAMQREIDELELKVKDQRIEIDALKRNE